MASTTLSKSSLQAGKAARPSSVFRSVRLAKAARSVGARAAADRPVWFPGNPPPEHLDGTLPGDFGFDPLYLSGTPELKKWMVHAELIHCRWAMLGAAGVLFQSIGAAAGLGLPQWYDAGKVALDGSDIPFGSLLLAEFLFFHYVEVKRFYDFRNPGSQADGSVLGITEPFKGTANGYPGGAYFDPFGLARGSPATFEKYKLNEIKNGRLAMVANLGFWAQYAATGKGPIDNLLDHLADPYHVTFATNGVSIPFVK